jgi:hypothetical protein
MQLAVIGQIFMIRKSAAAVQLLHVIMLDEMRRTPVRQMLRNSLDESRDAMVVPGNPPARWTLLPSTARQRGAPKDHLRPHSQSMIQRFTASAMSVRRSCIRPTEHIAIPDRQPRQVLRVKRREFVMFVDWKPSRYSRYDPRCGRLSSMS